MHNLIYLSATTDLLSNENLLDILKSSRKNNSRLCVTGLLLYHEGSVLQILEGEKEVLHALYGKIKMDPRHKGLIKLVDAKVNNRSFSDWSMGFKQISKEDWSALEGFLNLENAREYSEIAGVENNQIITLIKSFGNVNRLEL